MRFLIVHKANPQTEAGIPPSKGLIASMGALIPPGIRDGTILAAEGLRPSSAGVRLQFSGGKRTVTKGPFIGSNEFIAGYCIMCVKSIDEAIEWSSRFAGVVGDVEIDIRPVTEPWDIGICPKPPGDLPMRFMAVHKATQQFQDPETIAKMGKLIDDMQKAGVFLSAQGLGPGSQSIRVHSSGGKITVIDGPFAESKELIAGFVMVQLESKQEAVDWASRYAQLIVDGEGLGGLEVDIRPVI